MDTLNDYYPLYPENPDKKDLTDSEKSEDEYYIEKILNQRVIRKRALEFDDFCAIHSDTMWYLWCSISENTHYNYSGILNKLDYPTFCSFCFENTS